MTAVGEVQTVSWGLDVRALGNRVIIKQDEAPESTKGGILVPEQAKERPARGTAVAVGPGKMERGELMPMTVSVGDRVAYTRFGGSILEIDGVEYQVLHEDDILCILEHESI